MIEPDRLAGLRMKVGRFAATLGAQAVPVLPFNGINTQPLHGADGHQAIVFTRARSVQTAYLSLNRLERRIVLDVTIENVFQHFLAPTLGRIHFALFEHDCFQASKRVVAGFDFRTETGIPA